MVERWSDPLFDATDATVFASREQARLMAQTVCGAVCEVMLADAPRVGRECSKCVAVPRNHGWNIAKIGESEVFAKLLPRRGRIREENGGFGSERKGKLNG